MSGRGAAIVVAKPHRKHGCLRIEQRQKGQHFLHASAKSMEGNHDLFNRSIGGMPPSIPGPLVVLPNGLHAAKFVSWVFCGKRQGTCVGMEGKPSSNFVPSHIVWSSFPCPNAFVLKRKKVLG